MTKQEDFKTKTKVRLAKLQIAKELYEEGIISLNNNQHKSIEREIDIITRLLDGGK